MSHAIFNKQKPDCCFCPGVMELDRSSCSTTKTRVCFASLVARFPCNRCDCVYLRPTDVTEEWKTNECNGLKHINVVFAAYFISKMETWIGLLELVINNSPLFSICFRLRFYPDLFGHIPVTNGPFLTCESNENLLTMYIMKMLICAQTMQFIFYIFHIIFNATKILICV